MKCNDMRGPQRPQGTQQMTGERKKGPVYRAFNELFGFLSVTSNPYAVVRKAFNTLDEIGAFERVGRTNASLDVDALIADKLTIAGMSKEELEMMDEYTEAARKGESRVCLFCKSVNVVDSSVAFSERNMTQLVTCQDCNGSWSDVYTLQGVLIESRPEVVPANVPGGM